MSASAIINSGDVALGRAGVVISIVKTNLGGGYYESRKRKKKT